MTNKLVELHVYTSDDGQVQVPMVDNEMWLSQKAMAALFGVSKSTIGEHVNNVIADDELGNSVVRKIRTTASDGKDYQVKHYNRDVIFPVGFRVNSKKASHFRRWANGILDDYLRKGVVVNPKRLQGADDKTLDAATQKSVGAIYDAYRARGKDDEWIRARLNGVVHRNDLTDMLSAVVQEPMNEERWRYGKFTNETYIGLFGRDAKQLRKENGGKAPRDAMTAEGLSFLAIAESVCARRLKGRQYMRFFEAIQIMNEICQKLHPSLISVEELLGIDLATNQPRLPRGDGAA